MGVSYITAGNFNIDNVVTANGEIRLQNAGGNTVYASIGAHIWSSSVGVLSVIPENYPTEWLNELKRAGIDLSGVQKASPPVDREEWFFYQPDGSRIDHIYAPSSTPDLQRFGLHQSAQKLEPQQVSALLEWVQSYPTEAGISFGQFRDLNPLLPDYIPDVYWPILGCHIAGNRYEVQLALVKAFKARGVLVSLDPSIDVADADGDLRRTEERLAELLRHVDIFLPSKKELQLLCPGMTYRAALLQLAEMGPEVVGVKLGEQGSLIRDGRRNEFIHIPAYPAKVVNLTGAGDAYCGGFLVGMVESGDPFVAAQFGSVSASLVIEKEDLPMALRFNRYQANLRLQMFQQTIASWKPVTNQMDIRL